MASLSYCRSYCKGKNLKANHNARRECIATLATVAATAKVRI